MALNRTVQLKKIRDEIWNLSKSPLYNYRKKNNYFPVIGEGNHFSKIIFIGEAPGQREAETGRPFCGAAGKILDELLVSIDLKRKDVYITNVVKDRPPNNRDPEPEEIKLYSPFLDRQILIIKPNLHGKVIEAKVPFGKTKIIPLYHPAVVLYSAGSRKVLEEDFRILKDLV
ncbi:MAG: Uracil-DNA glycosylase, family 4 [Candidatus Curtissbacteria bacterium GW2011_GWA1_40_47]|nr:MAG: Uracil-DNA glycosylase, family 4 [Candidatus Curtissbacteria bacterium GW2011_GWA1_40_47]